MEGVDNQLHTVFECQDSFVLLSGNVVLEKNEAAELLSSATGFSPLLISQSKIAIFVLESLQETLL
jgi:hypothetical protein